jgi:hypothetical protein
VTNFSWWAAQVPAGRFLCRVCCDSQPLSAAWRDADGQTWDVCTSCTAHDDDAIRRRDTLPTVPDPDTCDHAGPRTHTMTAELCSRCRRVLRLR